MGDRRYWTTSTPTYWDMLARHARVIAHMNTRLMHAESRLAYLLSFCPPPGTRPPTHGTMDMHEAAWDNYVMHLRQFGYAPSNAEYFSTYPGFPPPADGPEGNFETIPGTNVNEAIPEPIPETNVAEAIPEPIPETNVNEGIPGPIPETNVAEAIPEPIPETNVNEAIPEPTPETNVYEAILEAIFEAGSVDLWLSGIPTDNAETIPETDGDNDPEINDEPETPGTGSADVELQ